VVAHQGTEGGVDGLELATSCLVQIQILDHHRALRRDVEDALVWAIEPGLGVEDGDVVDGGSGEDCEPSVGQMPGLPVVVEGCGAWLPATAQCCCI
jgi:hypothetical protein